MDIIFSVEELFLQSKTKLTKRGKTQLIIIHKGYYSSLLDANNVIYSSVKYADDSRLGFYIKVFPINPKPGKNDIERQYSIAANGERILIYHFFDPFFSHFEGRDSLWKVGDKVLFEYLGSIRIGRITKKPHTKQWFVEHAQDVNEYYRRLNCGELNENDDRLELADLYQITTEDDDHSIYLVKPFSIFSLPINIVTPQK